MSTAVVLLVVASAVVHAAWNAVLKRRRDPEHAVFGVIAASAATAVMVALALGAAVPSPRSVLFALLAGLLEAGYFLTLARALSRAPLGPVYTLVRGGALVLVWPVSVLALGEELTLAAALGSALVVSGLALAGASERTAALAADALPPSVRPGSRPSTARRYRWALACAAFVAGYHLAYKLALSLDGSPQAVIAISLTTASLLSLALLDAGRRGRVLSTLRAEPLPIAVAGVLATASFAMFLEAMARSGAGAVLTLRNTSILFAQALALALGDRPRGLGLAGAGLVTLGAVLLTR